MNEALKVAGAVCILALLGADLGLQITRVLSPSSSHGISPDYLALATFLVLVFQAWIFHRQATISERQADIMREQARAFVFGQGFQVGLDQGDEGLRNYLVFVVWENVGNTTAIEVRQWIGYKILPMGAETGFEFARPREGSPAQVLGPRGKGQTGFMPIPVATMIRVWRREIRILVRFRIEYRDRFDSTILHHHEQVSRIELIHEPSTAPPEGHPPYVMFASWGPQNTAS